MLCNSIRMLFIVSIVITGCGRFDYVSSENPFSKSGECRIDSFDNYDRSQLPPAKFGVLGVVDKEDSYPRAYPANINDDDDGAVFSVRYESLCSDSKITQLLFKIANFSNSMKSYTAAVNPSFSGQKSFTIAYRDDACFYHGKEKLTTFAFAVNEDGNSYYAGQRSFAIEPKINDYIQSLSVKEGIKTFRMNLKTKSHNYNKVQYLIRRDNIEEDVTFPTTFTNGESRSLKYLDYKRIFTTSSRYHFNAIVYRQLDDCSIESQMYATSEYITLDPTVRIHSIQVEYKKGKIKPVKTPIVTKSIVTFAIDMSANYAQNITSYKVTINGRTYDYETRVSDSATEWLRYEYKGEVKKFRIRVQVRNEEGNTNSEKLSYN